MAKAEDGAGYVPHLSAPGLIIRGLVVKLGERGSTYLCQLTEPGRAYVSQLIASQQEAQWRAF